MSEWCDVELLSLGSCREDRHREYSKALEERAALVERGLDDAPVELENIHTKYSTALEFHNSSVYDCGCCSWKED